MFLIDNGADPNRMDFLGRTPLHVAAADDYPDMVKLLIDSGGTVNPVLRGHSKRTPKIVFKTHYRVMHVKSIAECSFGAFCSTFDLHYDIKWPSDIVLSIFEWPLKTSLTLVGNLHYNLNLFII